MNHPGVHIRPVRSDDLPGVRDLLVETWHDTYDELLGAERVTAITDEWHSLAALSRQLELPETACLLAEEEGRIIGHIFANAQHPPVLFLSRLYVRPSRQRRGIGNALLDAVVTEYPQSRTIRLEVEAGNSKAIPFYERAGFRPVRQTLQDGITHIQMEKQLT